MKQLVTRVEIFQHNPPRARLAWRQSHATAVVKIKADTLGAHLCWIRRRWRIRMRRTTRRWRQSTPSLKPQPQAALRRTSQTSRSVRPVHSAQRRSLQARCRSHSQTYIGLSRRQIAELTVSSSFMRAPLSAHPAKGEQQGTTLDELTARSAQRLSKQTVCDVTCKNTIIAVHPTAVKRCRP